MQLISVLAIATVSASAVAAPLPSNVVPCWTQLGGECYDIPNTIERRQTTVSTSSSPVLVEDGAIFKVSASTLKNLVTVLHLDPTKVSEFFGLQKSDPNVTAPAFNSPAVYLLSPQTLDDMATFLDVPLDTIANYFGLYAEDEPNSELVARGFYRGERQCFQTMRGRCWRASGYVL